MGALQTAIKQIGSKVARAGIENLYGLAAQKGGPVGSGDTQKKLDVVAVSEWHTGVVLMQTPGLGL